MSASDRSMESSLNLITSQNLETALKNQYGDLAKYQSHSVEDFIEKANNFTSYITAINLKFSLDGEEQTVTFIAKLDPYRKSDEMDKFTRMVFEKECGFYNKIVPEINNILTAASMKKLSVPKCYFAHNESSNRNIIYLEDMRKRNFVLHERSEGLSKEQAELVVAELARLHASSVLVSKKIAPEEMDIKFPFLKDVLLEKMNDKDERIFSKYFRTVLETGAQIGEQLDGYGKFVEFLRSCIPEVEAIVDKEIVSAEPFTAILHGDSWVTNLLFKNGEDGKPEEVCIIDLQAYRRASVGLDLVHFMFTSLCGDVRQPHMKDLLATYHSSYKSVMTASGEDISFTKEELYGEVKKHSKYGMLMCLLLVPMLVMDSDSVPDLGKISNENLHDKMKENQVCVVKMVEGSPEIKKRFRDIFDDLIALNVMA